MNAHHFDLGAVHVEPCPAQHERDPWWEIRPVDAPFGKNRMLRQNDQMLVARREWIDLLERAAKHLPMRARRFLEHNGISGLICKKCSDLVYAIIAAP